MKRRLVDLDALVLHCNSMKLPAQSQYNTTDCVKINMDDPTAWRDILGHMQAADVLVSKAS